MRGEGKRVAPRIVRIYTLSLSLLILAAIICWQIREDRSCFERGGLGWPDDLNFELLSHISPIGWDNVLLYGEYQLNRSLVRSERLSVSMIAVQISWAEQRRLLKTREKASPKGCSGDQVAALDKIEIMLLSQLGLHSRQ